MDALMSDTIRMVRRDPEAAKVFREFIALGKTGDEQVVVFKNEKGERTEVVLILGAEPR